MREKKKGKNDRNCESIKFFSIKQFSTSYCLDIFNVVVDICSLVAQNSCACTMNKDRAAES